MPATLSLAGQAEGPRGGQGLLKRQELLCLRLLVAGAEPVAPPLPPAVLVDIVWPGGHVGWTHACLAPRLPPCPAGHPGRAEGLRHGQRLPKRQELLRAGLGVAGAEPVAPPLPPAVLVGAVWGGRHVGWAHACLAPRPPLCLAGHSSRPEGLRHDQRLPKRQELAHRGPPAGLALRMRAQQAGVPCCRTRNCSNRAHIYARPACRLRLVLLGGARLGRIGRRGQFGRPVWSQVRVARCGVVLRIKNTR